MSTPFLLVDYVAKHPTLLKHPDFAFVKKYMACDKEMAVLATAFKATIDRSTPKFKFGVEVARDVKHAIALDQQNSDGLW